MRFEGLQRRWISSHCTQSRIACSFLHNCSECLCLDVKLVSTLRLLRRLSDISLTFKDVAFDVQCHGQTKQILEAQPNLF